MAFIFVCGTQDFSSRLKNFESLTLPCANCHNHSVVAVKRRNWFTFCYIPIFPIQNHEELECTICHARSEVSMTQLEQIRAQQGQAMPMGNMQPQGNPGMDYPAQAHGMAPPPQGYYGK